MRLTKACDYAIRCIHYLSAQDRQRVVPRKEIAREMQIPNQFLSKIAQQLAYAKFIEIVQGAAGGYRLRVPTDQLSLLDVVEAVMGELVLNDCVLMPHTCFQSSNCSIRRVWVRTRNQMRETLRQATFSRILADEGLEVPGEQPMQANGK
jgi:Rrf2 family iron-sulfur cluster assembly transcriptional regulator